MEIYTLDLARKESTIDGDWERIPGLLRQESNHQAWKRHNQDCML